jgi:hypothetical protein
LRQFGAEHPTLDRLWFERSNCLVLLAVENETALGRLLETASQHGVRCAAFREPDLRNSLTAVALEPGPWARQLCRHLPLALGEPRAPPLAALRS